MYLSHLALDDYRSYEHALIECVPGVNVFVGHNGNGKTNIVEAIAYLATLSSHRVAHDTALVKQGKTAAVIQARVMDGQCPHTLGVEIYAGRANRAKINKTLAKPSDILGMVRTVLFAPEDLRLIRDEPSVRRHFLDMIMIQQRPMMSKIRSDYEKVLTQRRALLKSFMAQKRRGYSIDMQALDVWDEQLVTLGAQIMAERAGIISGLRPHITRYYDDISGSPKQARVDYKANADSGVWDLPSAYDISQNPEYAADIEKHDVSLCDVEANKELLRHSLAVKREKEIDRGANLVGPHRDDMVISLGTFPAKGYASHGESWSLALALRLASWELMSEDDNQPILILDDVFAELDSRRRERLADIVSRAEQVFVTAAVDEDIPVVLDGQRYIVTSGEVVCVQSKEESDE